MEMRNIHIAGENSHRIFFLHIFLRLRDHHDHNCVLAFFRLLLGQLLLPALRTAVRLKVVC